MAGDNSAELEQVKMVLVHVVQDNDNEDDNWLDLGLYLTDKN
jgi:hypothetical protein